MSPKRSRTFRPLRATAGACLFVAVVVAGVSLTNRRGNAEMAEREITTLRAADMVDSIGVNTHIAYTDGRYANAAKIVESLRYVGIDRIRDTIPNEAIAGHGWANYPIVAQAGIKFDFVAGGSDVDLKATIARLEQFEKKFPGSILSVEGPNEYDNWPFEYGGVKSRDAVIAFQNDLDAQIRQSPGLKHIPMLNLTMEPPTFGRHDMMTIHMYPKNGEQPRATFEYDIKRYTVDGKFFPAALTEIGFYTLQKKLGWGGVDATTQARLTLNSLLVARQMGFAVTYLYELFDAYPDPELTQVERHFGLFYNDYSPKPVAEALRRLTGTLADSGPTSRSFEPEHRRYTLQSESERIRSLAFRKSTGESVFVIWDEREIWDAKSLTPREPGDLTARLAFDGPRRIVSVTDTITGAALAKPADAATLDLTMRGNPILVVTQ